MENSNQIIEIPNSHLFPSLVNELREVLWGEEQLIKAIGTFKNSTLRGDLRQTLQDLDADIEQNIGRVRSVFKILDLAPGTKESKPMLALLQEAHRALQTFDKSEGVDVALIQVVRKILGYRRACFRALVIYSGLTGYEKADLMLLQASSGGKKIDLELESMAMSYLVD